MELDLPPRTVDLAGLHAAVGAAAYARGMTLARQAAAVVLSWDPAGPILRGVVRGRAGVVYAVDVQFHRGAVGPLRVDRGRCDCPDRDECKHLVALVVTAFGDATDEPQAPHAVSSSWERSIGALARDPSGVAVPDAARASLAVRVELISGRGARPVVRATVVRQGRSGWVADGLSWGVLDVPHHMAGFAEAHVRVLRELRAVYRARAYRVAYAYDERHMDLTAFESPHLWPLLDEAQTVGVMLVQTHRLGGGPVPHDGQAELHLDVIRRGGDMRAAPVVRTGDQVADPVAFIGTAGHGVVLAGPGYGPLRPLALARLDQTVATPVQDLVLQQGSVTIPAVDRQRFLTEYYPRLRRTTAVTSSDGSFVPPDVSAPTLVLHAEHAPGHELELTCEWSYEVGGIAVRAPVDASDAAPYRHLRSEREIMSGLAESLQDVSAPDVPFAALTHGPLRLAGMQTARFSTEVMPLLRDQPGVAIEVAGEQPDYREATDSVQIGLSIDAGDDPDWFDLGVTIRVDGRPIRLADVIAALARDQPYLLLPDGAFIALDKPQFAALRELLAEARALDDRTNPIRISRYQVALSEDLAAVGVIEHQARTWREQVEALPTAGGPDSVPVPASLVAELRPYQRHGLGWLAFLWRYRLGGILADDMGLGKTVQSLALMCHARASRPDDPPFLIVAPTSVVANWAAEAAAFAPGLTVATVTGTSRRRKGTLADHIAGADVVVTSYTLLRLEADEYTSLAWSGLLLDEAQYVKNHRSKTYRAAQLVPAPFKLAITGTPIENDLTELWALFSIVAPGLLPSVSDFQTEYATPIEKRQDGRRLALLRRRVRPLLLRRTKSEVATDLPPKQEQVLDVDLHPRHRLVYDRYLQRERQRVLGLVEDLDQHRFTILRSLTVLRQLSLHAGLVDDDCADLPSAKVDQLVQRLHRVVDGGHRALVFSQFTRFLGVVRDAVAAAGIEHCYLDGSTRDRGAVVRRFASGAAGAFLISLKAGGVGLNLTEADYVFILDPWWNPATEAQAIDRTHRIGQTKQVMVYRLIAACTIEEKVLALQQRKAALFADVMDGPGGLGPGLTADDIRGLFT